MLDECFFCCSITYNVYFVEDDDTSSCIECPSTQGESTCYLNLDTTSGLSVPILKCVEQSNQITNCLSQEGDYCIQCNNNLVFDETTKQCVECSTNKHANKKQQN